MDSPDSLPLEDLGLSHRSFYALRNAGMATLGDVRAQTEVEIVRIPNIGRGSLNEIKRVLEEHGHELVSPVRLFLEDMTTEALVAELARRFCRRAQ